MVYLIKQFRDQYATRSTDIGTLPDIEFTIKLTNDKPINKEPYPLSFHLSDILNKQILEYLKADLIEKSDSPYAFPMIMVKKPTRNNIEDWRPCVDYRELNKITVKDKYRIPAMRDLYRKLGGNKIFSSFDLKSAYHHIPIKKEDRYKTAFITDQGQVYQWKRMAFGFTNAPAVFQRAMDNIFKDLDFVVVYLDDIIVCSKTEEEHIRHLQIVFSLFAKHNLKLRLQKCEFFQTELKYLGIVVTKDGIHCDQGYVDQVLKFKKPENVKEIERFIGMVTWLGRFIPNLSKLTSSLNKLRKKNTDFIWNDEHERSYRSILAAVQNAKVLRHPDLNAVFCSNRCIRFCNWSSIITRSWEWNFRTS